MTFSVAVAGASGYAGGELLRILADHPEFVVKTVTAHSNAGQLLGDVQPHLRSLAQLTLSETTAENLRGHDVVFVALPHGTSGALTAGLDEKTLVVDCGADHRLVSETDWNDYYGGEFFEPWAYGIPELPRAASESTVVKQRSQLTGARRIAAPGCNASAVALALAPAVSAGLVESEDLVSVLAVGTSGAGKAPKVNLLASEVMGSANPYAVGGTHRHIPEILQSLRTAGADRRASLSFTPVLVPMSRGILATSTATLKSGVTEQQVRSAYQQAYGDETFVQVLPAGQTARTADALGANTCLISLAIDAKANRLVVISAIDNLVKGTAGAAVQCANIALGIPENAGLTVNGVAP